MTQYIPKDALLAEIDNMLKTKEHTSHLENYAFNSGRWKALKKVKYILNTLEVIEIGVDLGDPKGDKSAKYIIDTKTLEVKEEDAIKWRTDIPQGDLIVAKVKEDFCDKKDCYEVLHFTSSLIPIITMLGVMYLIISHSKLHVRHLLP